MKPDRKDRIIATVHAMLAGAAPMKLLESFELQSGVPKQGDLAARFVAVAERLDDLVYGKPEQKPATQSAYRSAEEDADEGAKQVILAVLGEAVQPMSLTALFEEPRVYSAVDGEQGRLALVMAELVEKQEVVKEDHKYLLKR